MEDECVDVNEWLNSIESLLEEQNELIRKSGIIRYFVWSIMLGSAGISCLLSVMLVMYSVNPMQELAERAVFISVAMGTMMVCASLVIAEEVLKRRRR